MRRYLFVCAHNFTRSKFGAEFLEGYLLGKKREAFVFSRGINLISVFLGKRLKKKDLRDLTKIFVMENWMKEFVVKKYNFDKNKILVLNIKDDYGLLKRKNIPELTKKFEKINWEKLL